MSKSPAGPWARISRSKWNSSLVDQPMSFNAKFVSYWSTHRSSFLLVHCDAIVHTVESPQHYNARRNVKFAGSIVHLIKCNINASWFVEMKARKFLVRTKRSLQLDDMAMVDWHQLSCWFLVFIHWILFSAQQHNRIKDRVNLIKVPVQIWPYLADHRNTMEWP